MNFHAKNDGLRLASKIRASILFSLFLLVLCPRLLFAQLKWVPQGAAPNLHGQVENIDGEEVTGGIQALAVHPTDPMTIYVGAVNGGIWKSVNAGGK